MTGIWIASYIALWLLVLVETVIFLAVLRQVGVLHTRIGPRGAMAGEGPVIGDVAPADRFRTVDGGQFVFRPTEPDGTLVALFVSPSCSACDAVVTSFRTFVRSMNGAIEAVLAVADEPSGAAAWARRRGWKGPVIPSAKALEALKIPSTPFAVTFDGNGRIQSAGLVNSIEQLESLLVDEEERRPAAAPVAVLAESDRKETAWEPASIR